MTSGITLSIYLFIVCSMSFTFCRRQKALSDYYGLGCEMVDVEEIQRLHPFLDTKDILGGIYTADDGSIDPTGILLLSYYTTLQLYLS